MGIEAVVLKQYQNKVNQALKQFGDYAVPTSEGWLKTVRKALGMSGSQLATRLGVTKGRVSQAESAELTGSATLKSIQNMAQAMDCRFVYAVIPEKEIESLIRDRAVLKAKEQIKAASTQMALEAQALSDEQLAFEVDRLASEIIEKMPSDLWNDE
ncbi:MAG: transcriptional regulator [Cycloclasticus sp. symbiont of Poecilosclerida sp. N]|nr:MAG: transcriptional regulator [Cycloclasticus sp. symbiont of Poecilosclerida sp. N]